MIKVSNKIDFDETTYRQIASMEYGQEWPIVYILFNDEEATLEKPSMLIRT